MLSSANLLLELNCWTLSSPVICPPAAVVGVPTCTNNDITLSWDPRPEAGVTYTVYSQEDGGATANYTTAQTSHVISGLRCSESYALAVTATDSECTSILSEQIQTDTGA